MTRGLVVSDITVNVAYRDPHPAFPVIINHGIAPSLIDGDGMLCVACFPTPQMEMRRRWRMGVSEDFFGRFFDSNCGHRKLDC
ncbi:hypothetical protein SUGI_0296050 [Cryptomeria japonica]|nr:hypothetical protein SUGI_0296050 [Cryptomeria japonica]